MLLTAHEYISIKFTAAVISGDEPGGLRSVGSRLLGLRVRIPPGTWMSVSRECCVFSGRVLCDSP